MDTGSGRVSTQLENEVSLNLGWDFKDVTLIENVRPEIKPSTDRDAFIGFLSCE